MSVPIQQPAFTIGEVSPALFGRQDLARLHTAASTMRNVWPKYTGGSYSRAGTKFVGFSKQTGRAYPPRLIPFQFNVNDGLELEFGNFYMRVISDGAFVTETPISITGATNASPAVITAAATGATSATANTGAVSSSYARLDTITLAGGTFSTPAVLTVTNTKLVSLLLNSAGTSNYAPGDTINLSGGTQTTTAVVSVSRTKVVATPTIVNGGSGGTDGTQTVTGTTGTGTKFQASVTVAGGIITAVLSLTVAGSYLANPTTPGAEPVTGASLVGAQLGVVLGVSTFSIFNAGVFTVNAVGGIFTQASSSGTGTGATFQTGIFGPNALSVSTSGVYTAFPVNPVAQASTSGSGFGATFTVTSSGVSSFNAGDWVQIVGINGMTQLNNQIYVVTPLTASTFQLRDVYGNPINSTAYGVYTSGGTVARIYTLTTPYSEADLAYLKFTQSADVMSLCLVNQVTLTEYAAQDLSRTSNTNWAFSPVVAQATVAAPATATAVANAGGSIWYQYVVTSVDPDNGTESIASSIAQQNAGVDISTTAGVLTITWSAVSGVNEYNIYKATPGYGAYPPTGSLFGYAGSAYGTQFIDRNIVADFSQVPPTHKDPFARGKILSGLPITGGSGYTTITLTINTSTGSGAVLIGVIVNSALAGIIVKDAGKNYASSDTVTVGGDGSGATASIRIGPSSGTYPSVPAYFQQRRAYANTINNPDTYFMSQPGAYTNFDSRLPTIATDAITGTPWAVQVNGIQFMVPMTGGLVVMTGLEAYLLTGGGGSLSPQPLTPSSQDAQPQGFNGCAPTIPPIRIYQDIIYVQSKGSIYRDFAFQISQNTFTGDDLTLNSSHLFTGFQTVQHAWCEEPYKILWSVRDDGVLLSLTYLKPEKVAGWARHDTNGKFVSVSSITETMVDALYLAVQRTIGSNSAYTIERMDDRIWPTVEDCWCVDCGLQLDQPTPNATLTASSPTGLGSVTGATGLIGGTGYSVGTTATVVDNENNGPGTGAVPSLTIVGGVITNVQFSIGNQGSGYVSPKLVITDPANTGTGASATLTLNNAATFTASASVFSGSNIGSVIRMGGGVATITSVSTGMVCTANITSPIVKTIPNSGTPPAVQPQPSGSWTMTAPITNVTGLQHLAGSTVTGLADGNVITPVVVPATGTIVLPTAASAITIGLGFQAQLQSVYIDGGEPTIQGQRKKLAGVTARLQNSRGIKSGANQPDGSTLSPMQVAPAWANMVTIPDDGQNFQRKPYNATAIPLLTGDTQLIPVPGGFDTKGQVAFQQDNPLPMEILSIVPVMMGGDTPSNNFPKRGGE